jgi:hypothetical protein
MGGEGRAGDQQITIAGKLQGGAKLWAIGTGAAHRFLKHLLAPEPTLARAGSACPLLPKSLIHTPHTNPASTLRTRLQDHVERRLSRPPHAAEAACHDGFAELRFAGLRT